MKCFTPLIVACAGLLAACGSIEPPATASGDEGAFQNRATAVAEAWQQSGIPTAWTSGFVPLQGLTAEPDWTSNGDLKASYGNGWIRSTTALPEAAGPGEIRFADGTSLNVPLVGAQAAYDGLPQRTGACPTAGQPPTCQWVTITAARMSTATISTTRGPAIVPAWRYTVAGLSQPLVSVAVAPSAITTLPEVAREAAPTDQRPTERVVSALHLVSAKGNVMTFDIGIGACDKAPRGLVAETPDLVIVGGSVTLPDAGTFCTSQLLSHRVEVHTRAPIGTRPIVDAVSAQPLLHRP